LEAGFLFLYLVYVYENFGLQELLSYRYLVTGIIGQVVSWYLNTADMASKGQFFSTI